MVARFNIRRERWSIEEIISDELEPPNRGAFALVIDDEHYPHFRHPRSREIALALESAISGGDGGTIALGEQQIRIERRPNGVTIHGPAGVARIFNADEARLLARDLTSPLAQTLTP
jgi:hypothetical protein